MRAAVVLPTYNERENIERIVEAILKANVGIQVVVVDDDSPDGTGQIADDLARRHPGQVHVVHRRVRGRGAAGIAGFKHALAQDVDCIIEMDADFSHDPRYIPQFLEEIRGYDIVIGSRFVKGGKAIRNPIRRLISGGANLYAQLLLGRGIKDWCGGYKCYRREALESLDFDEFYSNGYSIGMETLYRLTQQGLSYKEIPIMFIDEREGQSKFSLKEILSYIRVALLLRRSRRAIATSHRHGGGIMKILIINWMDITHPKAGGAEVYLHEIAKRLVASGYEVSLLCTKYKGCKARDVVDGIEIIRRGSTYTFNLAVPWAYLKELRREGYNILIEDINKMPFFSFLFVRKPRRVILANHLFKGSFLSEVSIPLIPIIWLGEKLLFLYRRSKVMALSESTKKDLVDIGIPEEKITIIQPGLDGDSYKLNPSLKTGYPSLVYLGMVKRYKNVDHLIKAMVKVREVLPEGRLFIAGRGSRGLYRELEELVDTLNLGVSVEFYGEVTAEEKVRLFQRAWLSVHPSAKEGWGITVIEANACGTPVVAYDVPGHRDSIRGGQTGLLVPYGDIGKLAEGINKLLVDSELRERMSQNALAWASEFSWDKSAAQFMAALESVVRRDQNELQE